MALAFQPSSYTPDSYLSPRPVSGAAPAQIPARVYEHPAATRARADAMYRRRRIGFAIAALIFAYGLWSLALGAVNIASADSATILSEGAGGVPQAEIVPFEPAPTYVVRSGDTLFSIAASLDVGGDLRVVVDQISALNDGAIALRPGQRLVLPAYASAD